MSNSRIIIGISIVLMFLMVACGAQQASTAPKENHGVSANEAGNVVSVNIKDFKFVPADITVKVGDTVKWTNEDSAAHTVESSDKVLKSDELSQGDTFSYTFTNAGKHDYVCGIHKSMHGSVTVR